MYQAPRPENMGHAPRPLLEYKVVCQARGGYEIKPLGRTVPGLTYWHPRARWCVQHLREHARPCRVYIHGPDGSLYTTKEIP